MAEEKIRIVTSNKKARHDYHIIRSIEAGIALKGTEVKSVREGKVSLSEAYARFIKGELWIVGMHIAPYLKSSFVNHDPARTRKLLLHRSELKKLARQVEEKGVTLVPLKVYFKRHLVKVEIGLARGKRQYDKRAAIAERDMKRDMDRKTKMRF
ncbi:MAG TPA: SsrA-binding protein SmpB [Caldithrix abyssi]|uniref:SsrA-binding protein n=1 Tax=Caldithrix abyssi TaxID=187145 RepID=A0A7V4U2Z8_CALAY|nr:SsrA-binding protein SmpB [Caldithrix abyssi]